MSIMIRDEQGGPLIEEYLLLGLAIVIISIIIAVILYATGYLDFIINGLFIFQLQYINYAGESILMGIIISMSLFSVGCVLILIFILFRNAAELKPGYYGNYIRFGPYRTTRLAAFYLIIMIGLICNASVLLFPFIGNGIGIVGVVCTVVGAIAFSKMEH